MDAYQKELLEERQKNKKMEFSKTKYKERNESSSNSTTTKKKREMPSKYSLVPNPGIYFLFLFSTLFVVIYK